MFSSFQVNVPQLEADVDREKAKAAGVPLQDLFDTMQIYLGSLYVNDFNRFGRTYQVNAQADPRFRAARRGHRPAEDAQCARRHGAARRFVKVRETLGPDRVMRYNGYPAADINGGPAPGYSSGQAQEAIEEIARAGAAQRHDVRMDRADVPADPRRQHAWSMCFRCGAAGVPGAGRAVRKPEPAAGRHPDRADVPASRHRSACGSPAATTTSSRRSA